MCCTQFGEILRWCGQSLSLPSASEFREATSFLLLIESSGKFSVPGLLLSRRASWYLHPELRLFAILDDAASRLNSLASGFPVLDQSVRQGALCVPGLFDAIGFGTVEELVETENAKFVVVGLDFATILLSLLCSCIVLAIVLVQLIKLKFWAQQREMADETQIKKIVSLIACEVPLCQCVCELMFGVNVTDLNFWGPH